MIQIQNNEGGTVIIQQTEQPKRKRWIRRYHIFGLWFAIANCRVQKRWGAGDRLKTEKGRNDMRDIKNQVYKKQKECCPLCGGRFDYRDMEAHHRLPYHRFPELAMKKRNLVMLCRKCHKEVHCNPYLNIQMQEEAAKHFGIDLKQRYDHADITTCPA